MRTKFIVSILGLLLVMGGAFFFFRRPLAEAPLVSAPALAPVAAPVSPALAAFRAEPPRKRVMELYERESARVGKVDPDPKATQKRLEEVARELKPEEISWLEAQAIDPAVEMDARFFAVYLMGLSSQGSAVQALYRVAMKPVPVTKNERRDSEERAQRMSAVEGMCTPENCKLPEARDQLKEIIALAQDEMVRDRAHRCLYACQYGKPVAEQDKEALRRIRQAK